MSDDSVEFARATGREQGDLVDCAGICLHRCVRPDWLALCRAAARAGFSLQAASAYRSFERQLEIWNRKASGARAVLDDDGSPVDIQALTPLQRVHAILRYSALPGSSRHHWGSDFDVIDAAALDEGYRVQLVDAEFYGDGPFRAMHDWLDRLIESDRAYGFYRPYVACAPGLPGVAAERWHISHRPQALRMQRKVNRDSMYRFYSSVDGLALRDTVLQHFDSIYQSYICEPQV